MSTPRNHHYVSETLTRNFVDSAGKVPFYDKGKNYFGVANSPKGIFSERDLNTTITEKGELDYSSTEMTLSRHFEQDFPKHYKVLSDGLESNDHSNLTKSIEYLMGLGIIGTMRTRQHQIETENAIFGSFQMIAEHAADELKASLYQMMEEVSGVKNKFGTNFKEVADKVKELMGETIYCIFRAPDEDYFILPDCTSVIHRAVLQDDVIHNGEVLKAIAEPIATVIFPVSSKIVLVCQAKKISPQEGHGIYDLSPEVLYGYNKLFYKHAHNRVVCPNKNYLETLIGRIRQENS